MSEVLGYIPEGDYTEAGVVSGRPGLYPRVAFTFRPLTPRERADYYRVAAVAVHDPADCEPAAALLAERVKTWDLVGQDGEVLPISAETMRRVKVQLLARLVGVVLTNEPGDDRPSPDSER